MALFSFFRKRKLAERVEVTDTAVIRFKTDGSKETIRWDDLDEVGIVTTDQGPLEDDVIWILLSSDGKTGCAVPQGIEGENILLPRFQQLPGFNNQAVIDASICTENARFVCWKRERNSS